MTVGEAAQLIHIPSGRLGDYIKHGIAESSDDDIGGEGMERLSLAEALYGFGFTPGEISEYLRGGLKEREVMLIDKRGDMLDLIHRDEKRLAEIDYLIHEVRKKQA